jgi:hypothetical protein
VSKRTAIKAYCRECAGGTYPEVILCHLTDCPLWPYRTGYSAASTAKSAKQALIRHPDIAKELADLGLDACFSQNAIKKPATWRRKSTGAGQTTGVKGKEVVDSPKHVIRKEQSGDALTGAAGPLEAQDERRHA